MHRVDEAELLHTVLEVAHIFWRDLARWQPQALFFRSHDHPAAPRDIQVPVIERLRHLDLRVFPNEQAQKGADGYRLFVGELNRAEVVPEDEPLLLDNVPQREGGPKRRLMEDMLRAEEVIKRIDERALPRVGRTHKEWHAACL